MTFDSLSALLTMIANKIGQIKAKNVLYEYCYIKSKMEILSKGCDEFKKLTRFINESTLCKF